MVEHLQAPDLQAMRGIDMEASKNVLRRPAAGLQLRLRRYGAGDGVYLDPVEARAAQATAELLHRMRTGRAGRLAGKAASGELE